MAGSSRVTSQVFASLRLNSPAQSEPAAQARSPMSAPEARCLTLPVAPSMASSMAVEPPADWLGLGDAEIERPVRTHDVTAGPGDVVLDDDGAGRRAAGAARSRRGERQVERRRALRLQLVGHLVQRDVVVRTGDRDVIGALVGEIGVGHAAARGLGDREGRCGQVRGRLRHRLGREPGDAEGCGRLTRGIVEQRRRRGHEPAGREDLIEVVVALVTVDREGDPRPVGRGRKAQARPIGDPRDQARHRRRAARPTGVRGD